jgi:hypothetical protein
MSTDIVEMGVGRCWVRAGSESTEVSDYCIGIAVGEQETDMERASIERP